MALQSLLLPIVSLFRSAGLNQASAGLRGLTKNFTSLGQQIGLAAGSFGAFSALTTAQTFTKTAVDATQKFERNLLALNQVFEEVAPRMENFAKQVENYGLSQQQAASSSVFLGSVLKQYGFSVTESADQTERLVKLAQDLATTYGYDVQEALLAITALFRGEYDPIEKFGVAMKQNEINAYLASKGLGDLEGQELANAQATARLTLLFERAGDSVGAFSRASDTLYVSQQRLNAVLGNMQIAAGEPLQAPLARINNIFADLAQEFGPAVVDIFEAMGQSLDVITPVIEKTGEFIFQIISPLQQVINILTGLFGPAITSITSALNIINAVLDAFNEMLDAISAQFALLELNVKRFLAVLEDSPFAPLIDAFEWILGNGGGVVTIFESIGAEFKRAGDAARAAAGDFNQTEFGARQAASAARLTGTTARETQQELENMAAANQAWTNAWTARAEAFAKQNGITLAELTSQSVAFRLKSEATSSGTDYVAEFFKGISEGVRKETARGTLESMGATEGLIDAILGSGGWEKVFKRIVSGGVSGLKDLQREFNKTSAGIDEMTKSLEEAEKAQKALRDAAQQMIDDNIANLQRAYDEAKAYFDQVQARAEEFKRWSLDNIATIQILPNFAEELGKFETSIIQTIAGIQSELVSAVRSGLIFEDDYANLSKWVETEGRALEEIAKRRDELASRFALSESLISEYQGAITGALRLTNLFNKLKDETETRMVTEVTQGVVKLGNSLKEFGVTITRSYEETIQKVQDKSVGLIQGFRDMADKSRAFAENLRKLRDMGLDPMLFDQLVSAGVEAGGETAQALVDGGSDTINEMNTIFDEINKLGAELGLDVGQTMYDAGKDMTYGLLDGIKSEQEQLYDLAKTMAETFSQTFKNNFSIAIDAPVQAAKAAADSAGAALEQAKEANVDLLTDVMKLIEGANKALDTGMSAVYTAGVENKKSIFESLIPDIVSGKVTSLPGLKSGLSSAEVEAIAATARGQSVTNVYNVAYGGTGNNTTAYSNGVSFANGIAAANASNPNLQTEMFGA